MTPRERAHQGHGYYHVRLTLPSGNDAVYEVYETHAPVSRADYTCSDLDRAYAATMRYGRLMAVRWRTTTPEGASFLWWTRGKERASSTLSAYYEGVERLSDVVSPGGSA